MRKVIMMSIEEEQLLPKLTLPDPPIAGQFYKYVNTEGKVFVIVKLLSTGYIEQLPIIIE